MNIVIFGPPGAGKGTQSDFIVSKYNLFQLSTGNLLRKEIEKKSELGLRIDKIINSGNLVSDDIVSKLVERVLSNKKLNNKIIFDGYPRNLSQANDLEKLLNDYDQKISLVLNLKTNLEIIKKRISGRLSCSKCGKIYNKFFNSPPKNGDCCLEEFLVKRKDDNIDVAIKRFTTYEKETIPVLDFYKKKNLLKEVNGETSILQIYKEISGIINLIEA
tara:strand:+ start:530 stop:1180 length:651 start_codon:yes stop_codon:yes gene_type:complete